MRAYLEAIKTGNLSGLQELAARSLAGQTALAHRELKTLLDEGLSVDFPILGKNAEGETEVIGHRPAENPRAGNLLKLLQQVGHTAPEQALTPKSRGEKTRDEGLGRAGQAAWVQTMRRGLADDESGDA